MVPFYCPALGWQGARTWWVHMTRIRVVEDYMHITMEHGPYNEIEEIFSHNDDENDTETSPQIESTVTVEEP